MWDAWNVVNTRNAERAVPREPDKFQECCCLVQFDTVLSKFLSSFNRFYPDFSGFYPILTE